ncbi:YbaN family protein [Pseudomonadota bacterium]
MKIILTIIGFIFLGLAILGAILPVMPTTCFVLGAAACFAKSSDRFYNWLLKSQLFGPIIRNWQATRSMPRRAKVVAISSILLSGALSVFLVESLMLKTLVLGLLSIPITIILMLPNSEDIVSIKKGP